MGRTIPSSCDYCAVGDLPEREAEGVWLHYTDMSAATECPNSSMWEERYESHLPQVNMACQARASRPDHEIVGEWASRLLASSIQTPEWESMDEQGLVRELHSSVRVARLLLAESRRQCAEGEGHADEA